MKRSNKCWFFCKVQEIHNSWETFDYSYGIHSYSLRITFHLLFSFKYLSGRTQLYLYTLRFSYYPQWVHVSNSGCWSAVLEHRYSDSNQQSSGISKGSFIFIQMGFFSCQRANTLSSYELWSLHSGVGAVTLNPWVSICFGWRIGSYVFKVFWWNIHLFTQKRQSCKKLFDFLISLYEHFKKIYENINKWDITITFL